MMTRIQEYKPLPEQYHCVPTMALGSPFIIQTRLAQGNLSSMIETTVTLRPVRASLVTRGPGWPMLR
jgi:hypothetical protein